MKEKLFVDAARVLIGTQEAIPRKVTPAKAKLLREIADILGMARQVSGAARSTDSFAWREYWQEVVDAQSTILLVAQGRKPAIEAVSHAANLCVRISNPATPQHRRDLQHGI